MSEEYINRITVYRLKIADFTELDLSGYEQVASRVFNLNNVNFPYQLYFLQQGQPKPASWFPIFSSLVPSLALDKIPNILLAGFVFIIKVNNSFYALSGGLGHLKVKKQLIEHRFGILLAQKILSLPELKGLIQKDTSGEVNYLNRVFRGSYNPLGDLSNLKRVLTHIRGKLKKESEYCSVIGKSIVAGDSLSVNGSKSIKDIFIFLSQVDKLWHADITGLNIPQLEHIQKRFEKDLLGELDHVLVNVLANFKTTRTDSLFLDNSEMGYLPDRVERYELIYNRKRHSVDTYSDLFEKVSTILTDVVDADKIGAFHKMHVRVFFDNEQTDTFFLFELICGDICHQNNIYFLNNGLWYRADDEYVKQLTMEIDNIPFLKPETLSLQDWVTTGQVENEGSYNQRHSNLSLLDKKLVFIKEEKGGVEFCDLLKKDGFIYLIHVKRATGAELRALFAQGYVSAKLYSDSVEFREKVHNAKFGKDGMLNIDSGISQALAKLSAMHKRDFYVVFAVFDNSISHKVDPNANNTSEILKGTLTTFAKVDLLDRAVSLRALGYNVAVTRIKPYPSSA